MSSVYLRLKNLDFGGLCDTMKGKYLIMVAISTGHCYGPYDYIVKPGFINSIDIPMVFENKENTEIKFTVFKPRFFRFDLLIGRAVIPLKDFPSNVVVSDSVEVVNDTPKNYSVFIDFDLHIDTNGKKPFHAPRGKSFLPPINKGYIDSSIHFVDSSIQYADDPVNRSVF